jgi:hypothetical protein
MDRYEDFEALRIALSENIDRAMVHHWGKVNKTRLRAKAGLGQGTYDRIKDPTKDIQLGVVHRIGELFGLDAWQLLSPNMDPAKPPVCRAMSPLAAEAARALDQIPSEQLRRQLHAMIEQLALENPHAAPVQPSPSPKPVRQKHR